MGWSEGVGSEVLAMRLVRLGRSVTGGKCKVGLKIEIGASLLGGGSINVEWD